MQRVPRSAHVAAPLVVLLGRFGLIDAATPVFLTPALQRLLAYVALSGRTVSRDRVAGVLWATVAETHAHMSLRAALARLSARAPGLLHADGGEVTLVDDVRVDLHEAQLNARALLASPNADLSAETAAAMIPFFSCELLPGWYDEWALLEAEGWRQLRLHALEALSVLLTRFGRYSAAIAAAHAAVGADPLRESPHAALISVHLEEGNQSEAMREFERYRRLLHHELGLEPTQRLRELLPG